jgi:tetratricopeptide (TPR) repeat protein
MLVAIRESLLAGDRTVVQALHGMGGVGKTQLAMEYAHRFAGGYDLVWWIAAEQAGLVGEQFALLAGELGCAQPGAELAATRRAVLAELYRRDRWLLVFDNAENPEALASWLPGGSGHVLITSRTQGWSEIAVPVEVDVLSRSESVAILRDRVPALSAADADTVAAALGDLPLAVVQAAGYMVDTGMSGTEYTGLLAARAAEILDQGRPVSYPLSLAAVTQLAFDRLSAENPAAAEVVGMCAFLAPEPIPADWFTHAAAQLPAPLNGLAADPMAWRKVLARIGRDALARIDHHGLQMHRLTQAILRSHLSPEDAAATRAQAEAMLVANHPGRGQDPGSWPVWAGLLPHLLAINPATSRNSGLRGLAANAAWYLIKRGDVRRGRDLAGHLYQRWRDRLGPDDESTLRAANSLAYALQETGDYRKARELDEDTLARRRRVLGEEDRATFDSAIHLAHHLRALGEVQAAREQDEDTLARCLRLFGKDHHRTLGTASNLAIDLRVLAETEAARRLEEDVLPRRRHVLGEDHPDTLISASNLAGALRELGDLQAARDLSEDTLARRRRVLGEDHPSTLRSGTNLAEILRTFGETQAARVLEEEILIRRREVLGEDHPDTLVSASNLVNDLRALGEAESARQLEEDTQARFRRVFGDDCPDLFSTSHLAAALHALAEILSTGIW